MLIVIWCNLHLIQGRELLYLQLQRVSSFAIHGLVAKVGVRGTFQLFHTGDGHWLQMIAVLHEDATGQTLSKPRQEWWLSISPRDFSPTSSVQALDPQESCLPEAIRAIQKGHGCRTQLTQFRGSFVTFVAICLTFDLTSIPGITIGHWALDWCSDCDYGVWRDHRQASTPLTSWNSVNPDLQCAQRSAVSFWCPQSQGIHSIEIWDVAQFFCNLLMYIWDHGLTYPEDMKNEAVWPGSQWLLTNNCTASCWT